LQAFRDLISRHSFRDAEGDLLERRAGTQELAASLLHLLMEERGMAQQAATRVELRGHQPSAKEAPRMQAARAPRRLGSNTGARKLVRDRGTFLERVASPLSRVSIRTLAGPQLPVPPRAREPQLPCAGANWTLYTPATRRPTAHGARIAHRLATRHATDATTLNDERCEVQASQRPGSHRADSLRMESCVRGRCCRRRPVHDETRAHLPCPRCLACCAVVAHQHW